MPLTGTHYHYLAYARLPVIWVEGGSHHFTNVLCTLSQRSFFFSPLRQMTAHFGRAPCCCGVCDSSFTCRSVTWIAERKDVPARHLHAYIARLCRLHARAVVRTLSAAGGGSDPGLLSKPMLATLPFVLLLLDYWPYQNRSRGIKCQTQVLTSSLEKIPLLALPPFQASSLLSPRRPPLDGLRSCQYLNEDRQRCC